MPQVQEIIAEIEAAIAEALSFEPEEMRLVRTGKHGDNAGSFGQYFATLDIYAGMMRDYAGYTLYPMIRMAQSGDYDARTLAGMFAAFSPAYATYLGYSGVRKLGDFAAALKDAFVVASVADIAAGLIALNRYVNRLNSWSHHYFPWALGEQFRYDSVPERDERYYETGNSFKKGSIGDLYIRMTWEPLGISAVAELATRDNPELCADFLAGLPFRVTQEHAVVTGESMYAWTPIMSTAPVNWREMIREAPFGRMRYSQNTGQKLIIQYGPTTEDLYAPVLGQILPEYLPGIRSLGEKVWDANYTTKALIWLTVEKI
ncbi:hypothetical protein [Martelella sp. HB161492]|uniref:cucumopine synthase-related protein n=1 Tax=Martelella sp. HB161492 TaxID=2720726 RepID=UPI0015906908|nr:hypothetical protein [Martelella sp. HB161492]